MSQNDHPLIYREEGEVAFIEINRPEMKNALNHACWQLLDKYCDRIIDENKIRALVITGRPADLFSAGVDVTRATYLPPKITSAKPSKSSNNVVPTGGWKNMRKSWFLCYKRCLI